MRNRTMRTKEFDKRPLEINRAGYRLQVELGRIGIRSMQEGPVIWVNGEALTHAQADDLIRMSGLGRYQPFSFDGDEEGDEEGEGLEDE